MRRQRKQFILLLVVIIVLFLGLGYAYLNTTLSINGTTDVDSNTWNVYWDNIVVSSGSVTGEQVITAPTISNQTNVSFHIRLKEPGEYYEFTVDAKNTGTIDAMIETINKTVNGNTTIPAYLNYTVTYVDGDELLNNHLLAANTFETIKVRVEYNTDINSSDLPTSAQSIDLSFGLSYIQANNNAITYKLVKYQIPQGSGSNPRFFMGEPLTDFSGLYSTVEEAKEAMNNDIGIDYFYLKNVIKNGIFSETYVVFTINSDVAQNHPEVTPEIYSLRGGDGVYNEVGYFDSPYYEENKEIMSQAFGSDNCGIIHGYYGNPSISYESGYNCSIDNLLAINLPRAGDISIYDESISGRLYGCSIGLRSNDVYNTICGDFYD